MSASGSRRSANPSALADEASSHWRSSIASTSPSSARSSSALRTATPSARWSTGPLLRPRRAAPPRAPGAGAASAPADVSSRTPSSRSPRPTCASARSDSAGRVESTRSPRPRASSTAARQSVDFPIPASPSSAIAIGPSPAACRSKNADSALSSSSLPTTSIAIRPRIVTRDRAKKALTGAFSRRTEGAALRRRRPRRRRSASPPRSSETRRGPVPARRRRARRASRSAAPPIRPRVKPCRKAACACSTSWWPCGPS